MKVKLTFWLASSEKLLKFRIFVKIQAKIKEKNMNILFLLSFPTLLSAGAESEYIKSNIIMREPMAENFDKINFLD